jgi:3-methyladenine DNA glycosylase AlkD
VNALAARIEEALSRQANPERAAGEKRYLKSELEHLGVSVPAVRRTVKQALPADLDREQLLETVDELWQRPIHECRAAATELLELRGDLLEPPDLDLIERLIRTSRTWALSDNLSASVAGPLIERHPQLAPTLDRWAADPDFWIRRASLLAELLALRRGEGAFDRFARHAEPMLGEREFFIRKAIGWVLRETAKKRPELVAEWLAPRASRASGLTVREAVKRMPEELRAQVLTARDA